MSARTVAKEAGLLVVVAIACTLNTDPKASNSSDGEMA